MSEHLLILPRLRVQNANCISSPMTWGFPCITAFTGFMVALERKLGPDFGLHFEAVGVVCHGFEAQVTKGQRQGGYTRSFHLSRNPVLQDGSTAAIVEEGRAHLDITLVFTVKSSASYVSEDEAQTLADAVAQQAAGMRVAGGSVMPALGGMPAWRRKPSLVMLAVDAEDRAKQFRLLRRQWLPGFALVSRHDVLTQRLAALQAEHKQQQTQAPSSTTKPVPTLLDAWLDLSRLNLRAQRGDDGQVQWRADNRPGWLVPMPVGFAALSALHPAGSVANARDKHTPFRFVESVYSMGQWISPHRLQDAEQFMWRAEYPQEGLYQCVNHYTAPADETLDDESGIETETDVDTADSLTPQFD